MMAAGDEGTMENQAGDREFGSWLDAHRESLIPGTLALDVGCGIGADAEFMLAAGLRVIGVDLSPQRVERAMQRARDASFVVANLVDGLPFRTECVDLVTASLSLHYFDRRTMTAIVQDIARVLWPGAALLCRVNVVGETQALWGVGTEHEPDFFEVEPGRFKRFFTQNTFTEALQPCFDIDWVRLEDTRVLGEYSKKTLVAQARRPA